MPDWLSNGSSDPRTCLAHGGRLTRPRGLSLVRLRSCMHDLGVTGDQIDTAPLPQDETLVSHQWKQ